MSLKSESEAPIDCCQWRVGGAEEVGYESSFEGVQGARIADGSRYIVPVSRCRDYKRVSAEVTRRMRPV